VAVNFGVEWQQDFFDHRLRNHHQLQEKMEYILMNPVRKGLCERMEDWVWVYRPMTVHRLCLMAGRAPLHECRCGEPVRVGWQAAAGRDCPPYQFCFIA